MSLYRLVRTHHDNGHQAHIVLHRQEAHVPEDGDHTERLVCTFTENYENNRKQLKTTKNKPKTKPWTLQVA